MKLNKKIIIFLFCVFFLNINAQKYELGKVTIEELKEKVHPLDSSASAAIIFKKGKTSFQYQESGFYIVTEIETKIKIYKKEGLNFANQSIEYYIGGETKEDVNFSKAITYNLVNGNVEKTKMKSEGEFVEKVNKNYSKRKISLPNVKEGSIIEFRCEIKSPYYSNFPDWKFQSAIPINYSEYRTFIPEYFFYNLKMKGSLTPKRKEETGKNTITFFDRDKNQMMSGRKVLNTSQTVEFDEKITTYTLENIPAIQDESYVNNIDNYISTIVHELSSTKFPGEIQQSYSSTWETVVKNIYENVNFGNELDKKTYFETDLEVITSGLSTNNEKINAIFDFVKSRMNWNEYNSSYCDEGVKSAYKNKTGNVAEINLMLVAMFRHAGINANPILVSTRANGISFFPSRTSYNYVICGIENTDNNQLILLDATSKNAQPNILPFRALNWIGRIIRKEGSSAEVDLMPKSNSKEVVNLMATIDAQGKISGKIKDQYFDYNAFAFRERNNGISKESYLENLEKKYTGIEIGEYEALNNTDFSKPVVENYSFTHTDAVEIIGDKMYFSPMVFFTQTKNPFTQETREYPIDFVFPHQDKYIISLTIPDGYTIETLPQSKAVGMPDNMGNFKYNISGNGKQCQLLFTVDINQAIIGSEYYEVLKNFFKELIDKQNEKIVLAKIKL